ncbi:MAG: c-type cytochrome [Synechococcaceae cyanobacterium]|nr:c-type cytochrome [Synechococcaceae cyanobacterium]
MPTPRAGLLQRLATAALLAALLVLGVQPVLADSGAQLFENHCAGCHAGGGNIIRRGKTLRLEALRRYDLASPQAIAAVAAAGRGQMSGYREQLGGDAGVQAVADWVWQQAQSGWKRP